MTINVLVVDDSRFFLRRIKEILEKDPAITVVDVALNGAEAVEKAARLRPDVITMDIEMPVMDGITAVRKIMHASPVPILMFSSISTEGAKATLDALDAGAIDYLPKRFEDLSADKEIAHQQFRQRVIDIARKGSSVSRTRPPGTAANHLPPAASASLNHARTVTTPRAVQTAVASASIPRSTKLVAIGTSTGGPVALQEVLTKLPADFPYPVILIQHMPGTFTPAFASRLNQLCQIEVKEAQDGDIIVPGHAYLAPGGRQMKIDNKSGKLLIRISESEPGQNYKPCVDTTFASAAQVLPGQVLAIVLTGMGADGREGARLLKQGGSVIWSQDEASCVVYGMPCAVAEAGLSDKVLSLSQIGPSLAQRH